MYDLSKWCDRLIAHEGMKLMPYRCTAGKLTIGVGRNLEDNPPTPEEARALGDYMHGITENAAKMLLRNDIARCFEALKRIVEGFEELDEERQYALLDMCFQMGVRGFRRFKRLLKAVEQRNFELAAFECLTSKYAQQTPKRAKRIAQRIGDRQERRAGGAGRRRERGRRRGQQCDGDGGRAGERRGAALYLKEHNDGAVGSVFPLFPETQGALLLYFLHGNPRQAF